MFAHKVIKCIVAVMLGVSLIILGMFLGKTSFSNATAHIPNSRYFLETEMPEYPGSIEYPISDGLTLNSVEVKISHFGIKENADKIRDHYIQGFEKIGYKPFVSQGINNGWNVFTVNIKEKTIATVSIIPRQDGEVDVFPAVVPLSGKLLPQKQVAEKTIIPISQSATDVTFIRDSAGRGQHVSYREPTFDKKSAYGYIHDALGQEGWNIKQTLHTETGIVPDTIQFSKGTAELTISFMELPESSDLSGTYVSAIVQGDN